MTACRHVTRCGYVLLATVLTSSCCDGPAKLQQGRNRVSARQASSEQPMTGPSSASQPRGPQVVEFMPGIRIDYRVPQVEIEAEVILRRGALELFAYSKAAVPKEHETILLLDVSPEAIYQALGLIGLVPGRPMRYLPKTQTFLPPTGEPVDVLVRYASGGAFVEVSACDWMIDLETGRPMAGTHWLFAGSRRLDNGAFYADVEGTTVTVVDFDSALLALPGTHSSSDAQLWLGANTDVIPPMGAKVTLLLRPALGLRPPNSASDARSAREEDRGRSK